MGVVWTARTGTRADRPGREGWGRLRGWKLRGRRANRAVGLSRALRRALRPRSYGSWLVPQRGGGGPRRQTRCVSETGNGDSDGKEYRASSRTGTRGMRSDGDGGVRRWCEEDGVVLRLVLWRRVTHKVVLLDTGDGIRVHPGSEECDRPANKGVAELERSPCAAKRRGRALRCVSGARCRSM
jgi:hypothetical protein